MKAILQRSYDHNIRTVAKEDDIVYIYSTLVNNIHQFDTGTALKLLTYLALGKIKKACNTFDEVTRL